MDNCSLPDQRVIEPGANPTARRIAPHRIESLGWGESDQAGDGAQAFQRGPGLVCRETEWSVLAGPCQRGVGLGETVRSDGKARRIALGQQSERGCMVPMRLGHTGDDDVAIE